MRLVFGIHNQFLIHLQEINGRLVMTFDLELNNSRICFLEKAIYIQLIKPCHINPERRHQIFLDLNVID